MWKEILIAILTLLTLEEFYRYLNLISYKKQAADKKLKCHIFYRPRFWIIGEVIYSFIKYKDIFGLMRRNVKTDIDFLMLNDLASTSKVVIIPMSAEYIKEFFAKEIEYCIKPPPFKDHFMGFAGENGPEAMRKRSIFAEVFKFDNLKLLCSDIRDLSKANFSHVANQASETTSFKIDIKNEILLPFFNKIGDLILFGKFNIDMLKGPTNETISKKIKKLFSLKITKHNLSMITGGLYNILNFSSDEKNIKKIQDDAYSVIRERYELRVKE